MTDPNHRLRAQIRAGRELLGLRQIDLANEMNTNTIKISRAESGETKSLQTLMDVKAALEKLGINFTKSGVEFSDDQIEIIEGEGCYLKLLDDVIITFQNSSDKELLIMCASDKASPPEVNDKYRLMRKNGVKMRQIINEEDTYIMGKLEEYRTIKADYFTNIVTLIYTDKVAQVNGDETRITIRKDKQLAKREKLIFQYIWDLGKKPTQSTAVEKF